MSNVNQDLSVALEGAFSTCRSALEALDNPGGSNDIAPPLDILRTDLISLFALVYSHATRASLAFKPPLTADAAAKSLSDMSGDLSRLVFCVQSFADNAHGRSMRKEVVWSAREVVENVESLVLSLFEMRQPRNANDKTYLLRTGSLHAAIDKSRQTLSVDNRAAVNRAWKTNNETLKDALKENRELIDEASAENEPEEDFDDGWGEVIESTAKMSETELGRSKKIYNLLRMASLLHGRIRTHYLSLPTISPPRLDDLLQHSNTLVTTSDDLVSALYAPQDVDTIQTHVRALRTVLDGIKSQLMNGDGVEAAASKMAELTVGAETNAETPNNPPPVDEWFETCFAQIDKAINALE